MGKTGSLRDYMADIALSNTRSGGGSPGELIPEDYLYTLGNIDTITLYGGKPLIAEAHQITEDTTIINTDLSGLDSMSITYKNGITIGCNWDGLISLNKQYEGEDNYTQQVIYFNDALNSTTTIRCVFDTINSGYTLWSITIQ